MGKTYNIPREHLVKLATWALTVALQAPEEPKRGTTYVPASTVRGLRKALEAAGIDWRRQHRRSAARIELDNARRIKQVTPMNKHIGPAERERMVKAHVKRARAHWRRSRRTQTSNTTGA